MKRIAVIATVAASLAAPAFAQSATDFAVRHLNQDFDSVGERVALNDYDTTTTVATRSAPVVNEVIARLNADQDSVGNIRGQVGVTLVSDDTAADEIFARLRAESLEDE